MMDEATWTRARNLAAGFSDAEVEEAAEVLANVLLNVLGYLLMPDAEIEDESVAAAKRQHPAFLPHPAAGLVPEFLEGEQAYEAAPVGTRVEGNLARRAQGWWNLDRGVLIGGPLSESRRVIHWGT